MRVLVACENSGTVRDAFIRYGHDAISCDLLPTEALGPHYQGDCRDIWGDGFDLMIAHPECTHLCSSGARWWPAKKEQQRKAIEFFRECLNAPVLRIAVENPVGIISRAIRPPDQIIQPWQFGHGEVKTTCLWLKGLYPLKPTKFVSGREQRLWKLPPSEDRWKLRSKTYEGIAEAMAQQWGNYKV